MSKLRVLFIMLALALVVGIAYASVPSTGSVDNPSTGAMYTNLTAAQTLGAKVTIGQNEFKYVLNLNNGTGASSPAFQGEPAYLMTSSADGYTVTNYRSSTYDRVFEGIWYCNASGGTQINGSAYGWIQTKGIANALVSIEAGEAIVEFDSLNGKVIAVASTDATARTYLIRSKSISSTIEAFKPLALEAVPTSTGLAFKKIYLK